MKITKIRKQGKDVYRVYLGTFDGKKRYKQFKKKGDADLFVRTEKIRRKSHGRLSAEVSPEQIVEWKELDQKVQAIGGTLRDAVAIYLRNFETSRKSIQLFQAVNDYLEEKTTQFSPYTLRDRRRRLLTFAESFAPDQLVATADPKPFLDAVSKKTSFTNADNSRRAVSAFYTWAVAGGYADENPIRRIRSYTSSKSGGVAKVLSPEQTKSLLETVVEEFDVQVAGYVLLSLFAGIRPMEFRKRITRNGKRKTVALTWEDFIDGNIRISTDLAKTGSPRLVPINPTMRAWLDWLAEQNGERLTDAVVGTRFKFVWADWKRDHASDIPWSVKDLLRHSYGTYRVSQAQEIGKVAIEMGNSEAIVRKHYWDALRSEKEAEKFWSILPPSTS